MPYENVDGQNVYYELKGSGETIVFIHAPVLPSQIFQQQAVNLTKGYCVLIFDLFGHGRTSPATAVWSFAEIARTLYKLLDRLNIKQAWICGYSAGASIAFEFASLYPERTAGLIPIGAADDKKGLLLKILVRASIWACRRKLVWFLAFSGAVLNTDQIRIFLPLWRAARMTDAHDAACYYRSYLDYRCRHKLQDMKQPVLLVYGEKDTLFKKYGPRLASQLPNCRFAHIEKARHYIPGKRDEALSVLIRGFIRS